VDTKGEEMALQWEFLGKQEMQATEKPGKGYVYAMSMWRTPVPGGWLLITAEAPLSHQRSSSLRRTITPTLQPELIDSYRLSLCCLSEALRSFFFAVNLRPLTLIHGQSILTFICG
jgi:hypothetical protein